MSFNWDCLIHEFLMTAKTDSKTSDDSSLMNSDNTLHQLLHGSPIERARAAENLAQQGSGAAYAACELTAACGDTDEVSNWAVAALEQLGPPPSPAVDSLAGMAQSENPLIGYWAVTLLGRAGPEAKIHQRLLAALLQDSGDLAVREKAAWSLGKMQADCLEATLALQQAAQAPEPRLSRIAAKALQQTQT